MKIAKLQIAALSCAILFAMLGGCNGGGGGDSSAPLLASQVVAGYYNTCARLDSGQLKCWGNNDAGTLGLGDVQARGDQPGEMGNSLPAVDLGPGRSVSQVSIPGDHACALLDGGEVKCWGQNGEGELGLGDTETRGDQSGEMGASLPAVDLGTGLTATQIGAGNSGFSCALLDNGRVKCWGFNGNGELGLGDIQSRGNAPGEMGDLLPAVDLGDNPPTSGMKILVTQMAVGSRHTCVVLETGQVKCWGAGGVLGLGDGTFRGFDPSQMGDNLPFVDLGPVRTATQIAAANTFLSGHSCVILDNGQLKCWGQNNNGQLGLGDTENRGDQVGEMGVNLPAVDLGTGLTASKVALGAGHSCALLNTGQVKCWGLNDLGQLGLGDNLARGDQPGEMGDNLPAVNLGAGRTAVDIAAGGSHSCAVLDTGRIKCWGNNSWGQLGLGDMNSRGDQAGEMGDALPAVDLGAR